ncbi:MAG: hypothetical protein V7L11_09445 [Nostoc sp.]|uniref:hypothetical protein n=1 Tax=Nostoc sp. TaxID=1180 RepID=UPI002FFBE838
MESSTIDKETLELATQDVRRVLERQKEERQILITQMNILFVTNSAILSFLTISRLITIFSKRQKNNQIKQIELIASFYCHQ